MSAESAPPVRVLVYSDDRNTREQVRLAVGRHPDRDLPRFEFVECATQHGVLKAVDGGNAAKLDVLILDGEATPTGGMGLCRQLKDEIYQLPPVLVLTGRPQDAWLATWSRAEAAHPHPLEPIGLARIVVELARRRRATVPAGA